MGIIRTKNNPVNIVNNIDLSWGAKGLMVYLLLNSNQKKLKINRDEFYLDELIESGYIEVTRNFQKTVIRIIE